MTKRKKSAVSKLIHAIFILLLIGILCAGMALGALCLAESSAPKADKDSQAIIVLGCQVYSDGRLSLQLQYRLEAARDEYEKNPRLIIVCGAQGENEPRPEGDVMKSWLIQNGVKESDVIAETESRNTKENLKNAQALLPPGVQRVTVITSDYHLPRALAIARDLGLSADGIGSPCKPEYWFKNHSREVLAWGKYLLEKVIGE